MKDGHYDIRFRTDGYVGEGHADVAGERITGKDRAFSFEGQLIDGRPHVRSTLNVCVDQAFTHNKGIPERFALQVVGSATDASFSLIGTGPLGVIVQIDGIWKPAEPTITR